jgi:hypothetical protein
MLLFIRSLCTEKNDLEPVGKPNIRIPKPQVRGSSPFRDAIFALVKHGSTAGFPSRHLHGEFVVVEAAGGKVAAIHQEVD